MSCVWLGTQYCDDCVYLAKTYKTRPEDDPVVKIRPRDDRFIFSGECYQRESPPREERLFFCMHGSNIHGGRCLIGGGKKAIQLCISGKEPWWVSLLSFLLIWSFFPITPPLMHHVVLVFGLFLFLAPTHTHVACQGTSSE